MKITGWILRLLRVHTSAKLTFEKTIDKTVVCNIYIIYIFIYIYIYISGHNLHIYVRLWIDKCSNIFFTFYIYISFFLDYYIYIFPWLQSHIFYLFPTYSAHFRFYPFALYCLCILTVKFPLSCSFDGERCSRSIQTKWFDSSGIAICIICTLCCNKKERSGMDGKSNQKKFIRNNRQS